MTARILSGESLARPILANLKTRSRTVFRKKGRAPVLAVLSMKETPALALHMRRQAEAGRDAGIAVETHRLPPSASEAAVIGFLSKLDADRRVDGILIETPLPPRIRMNRLSERLSPGKDVEGVAPENYGRLFSVKTWREVESSKSFIPPTAHAIARLCLEAGRSLAGKNALVIGRSAAVGRPAAHLLSCLDATVTLCHSKTRGLPKLLRSADIVVAAEGRAHAVRAKDLKRGCIVVDAGISYKSGKLAGDVEFDQATKRAGAITPVPGGVGPLSIALLLSNAVLAAERGSR